MDLHLIEQVNVWSSKGWLKINSKLEVSPIDLIDGILIHKESQIKKEKKNREKTEMEDPKEETKFQK